MLREATPALLEVVCAQALGMDYLALSWSTALPGLATPALDAMPADSLVLDCGSERDALAWGRSVGIQLFAGPVADRAAERSAGRLSLGERTAAA